MPVNDPNVAVHGDVRNPRLRILSDGVEIPGAIEASVTSNTHYQADRFSAKVAVNADPRFNMAWWLKQPSPMMIDIQVGIGAPERPSWTSLLVGEIDNLIADPDGGQVSLEGRDLSARLIETKTQESFQNRTSSEIATILAQRHGLTPDVVSTQNAGGAQRQTLRTSPSSGTTPVTVDTVTGVPQTVQVPTLAGVYYQIDHVVRTGPDLSRVTTEWDLLAVLARYEGYDLWVDGTTLHFRPPVDQSQDPYIVRYAPRVGRAYPVSNAMGLSLEKAFTLAKDVEVVVQSFHSKTGRSFSKTARRIGVKPTSASPAAKGVHAQRYVFMRPNLTEDQAQKLANSYLEDISKHERVIQWREPGNLKLTQRTLVRLEGTQSDFDQTYFIDVITRDVSIDHGFTMRVRAKNHNTESQAVG